MSEKSTVTSLRAPQAIGPYSQAIRFGDWVFLSGQIPLDETGKLVGDTIEVQTEQVLKNLSHVLEACGSRLDRVVKTTVYLVDLGEFARFNEVYAKFFHAPYPARATVQVARLPKDVRVEIEAIAIL